MSNFSYHKKLLFALQHNDSCTYKNGVIQKEPIGSVLSDFSRGSGKNTSTVKTVPLYTYEPQQKSLLITKITQTVYFAPPRQTAPSIFVIGQSSNTLKKKKTPLTLGKPQPPHQAQETTRIYWIAIIMAENL